VPERNVREQQQLFGLCDRELLREWNIHLMPEGNVLECVWRERVLLLPKYHDLKWYGFQKQQLVHGLRGWRVSNGGDQFRDPD
jgi:hypothetical protein